MKKLLLGLGSIATVVAPVITVVSCGKDDSKSSSPTTSLEKAKVGGFVYNAGPGFGNILISKAAASKAGSITITNGMTGTAFKSKYIEWFTPVTASLINFKVTTTTGTTKGKPIVTPSTPIPIKTTMFVFDLADLGFDFKSVLFNKRDVEGFLENVVLKMIDRTTLKNKIGILVTVDKKVPTKLSEATIASIDKVLSPIGLAFASATTIVDATTHKVTVKKGTFKLDAIADVDAAKALVEEINKVSLIGALNAHSTGYAKVPLATKTPGEIKAALLAEMNPTVKALADLAALEGKMTAATNATFKFGIKKALTAAGSIKAQVEVSINGCTPQLAEITITLK